MSAQHELPEFKDIIGRYPECNRYDGYLMITRWPWFFCDNHKTKWWLAAQECSQQEIGEDELRNALRLADYQEVPPYYMRDSSEINDIIGTCPQCGRCDGFVNFGRSHVAFCEQHQTMWWWGANILSS